MRHPNDDDAPGTLWDIAQQQLDRAIADFASGDYSSPAGHASEPSGAGEERGTATGDGRRSPFRR